MSIALTEEHQELTRVARTFLEDRGARSEARALLEAPSDQLPAFWKEMAELGWLGLHIDEAYGGQGFGLAELQIVVEALGHALAPGPFLPTTLASALIVASGSDAARRALLPGLADGSLVAAVGLAGDLAFGNDGLSGEAPAVLGAELAGLFAIAVDDDVVLLTPDPPGITIETRKNLDPSRRVAALRCEGVQVPDAHRLRGARGSLVRLARTLSAAEAAGGARACTEMATAYAKERQQFGRPIGTFGPVKHHCTDMLAATEQATAGAWGAARAELDPAEAELAAATACALALPAFAFCANQNVQVHGGIGYTWEHDAHLYVRRAIALEALFGPVDRARDEITGHMGNGVRTRRTIELPSEAEPYRDEARAFAETFERLPKDERRRALCDSGYLVPHWPKPWGREAGPIEQLAIEEIFRGRVRRPDLSVSAWNTLTIAQHGDADQRERFVRPSLLGEIEFCQLFSEPGAGSDAAAVQTRGVRVEGGWRVSGQKVWTSLAQRCSHGFATVRTNPDAAKHQGITMMVIDLKADGVEVRPLRQVTGHSEFNEVFFDEVFVPDADVVGPVDQGWTVARSTLGNERISLGGGSEGGMAGGPDLLDLLARHAPGDTGLAREVGAALAATASIELMNLRTAIRAVEGSEPGAEANVTKLLGSEQVQRKAALMTRIVGPAAAMREGEDRRIATWQMATLGATIGGGTSEILRNQIAERLLGLPRDPLVH